MSVKSVKARYGHMLAPICVLSIRRTQDDFYNMVKVTLGKGQGTLTLSYPKPKAADVSDMFKNDGWVGVSWNADPAAPNAGDWIGGNNYDHYGHGPGLEIVLTLDNIGEGIEYAWAKAQEMARDSINEAITESRERRERIAKSQEGLAGGLNVAGPLFG